MISIRRYLITVLMAALTLLIFLAALNGYRQSLSNTAKIFDAELISMASIIALSSPSKKAVDLEKNSAMSFQLWRDKKLVLKSSNAPARPITDFIEGFSEKNFSGSRWQTFSHYHQKTSQWVLVAEKKSSRVELAEKVILSSIYPIIFSIPIAAILIWFILSEGLKPLTSITKQLTLREADNLDPIQIGTTPAELQTVINTINRLLNRLQLSFDREKRFAGDAAHELRTPLSVLKINMHNLEKELSNDNIGLGELKSGAERMSHVIDQILTLYRTSPEQFSGSFDLVDVFKLCQQSISEYYPEIAKKYQSIELEGETCLISGESFALLSLLQNLISNASKYTPENGNILVKLESLDNSIQLSVEDSGEGIPEELYQQVFQRFYRVGGDQHKSGAPGCGLGLSIVQHIVDLHQASIKLSHSRFKTGLKTTVIFQKPTTSHRATENG